MTLHEINKDIEEKEKELAELKELKAQLTSEKFVAGAMYQFHSDGNDPDTVLCIRVWSRDNWFLFLEIKSMKESPWASNAQTINEFLHHYPNVRAVNRLYLGQNSLQEICDTIQDNQTSK